MILLEGVGKWLRIKFEEGRTETCLRFLICNIIRLFLYILICLIYLREMGNSEGFLIHS